MKNVGFTLLELLISISILMVITGGILAGYNTFNDNRRLREAAITLKTDLRFAQNKAQAGVKPASGCTTLDGYTVSFTATTYSVQASCTPISTTTKLTSTLPSGVTFYQVPESFMFGVLSQGINIDTAITITLIGTTKTYRLLISPSGDITDLGYSILYE